MTIAVLDYSTGDVYIKKVPKELKNKSEEEIIDELGLEEKNISYMINSDSVDVVLHTDNMSGVITLK